MKYILFILIVIFFSGCDTPALLILQNNTDNNAVYRLVRKDSIKINESISPKSRKYIRIIGLMNWEKEDIEKYIEKMQYMEIISQNDSIRLTGRNEMIKYIESKRSLSNQIVKIVIE